MDKKTITVSKKIHKLLWELKLFNGFKSIDDTIKKLITNFKKKK